MATVSVIIPAFNGAEFVAAAIESALAQTYADTEVITIDDGSTDETAAVLERFGSRIRVIRQPNRGLAAARNAGIALAGGEYVALLDADDTWEPAFLELAVARLAAAGGPVVGVSAGWVLTDRGGRPLPRTGTVLHGTLGLSDLLRRCPFPPSTVTVRRAAVLAAGGFDDTLRAAEDWDLWLRLTAAGGVFIALDHCLCRYRVHEHNWSRDAERMRTGGLRALEKLFADSSLPAALRAEQAPAVAHVHARACAQLYALGREADAANALRDAARVWPEILLEDETHWAVICAEQPAGYKGSSHLLDLDQGERRILSALRVCSGDLGPSARAHADGRAYRALAQLAYGQRHMAAVRRFAVRALQADPSLYRNWNTVGPLVKSFAGAAVINTLRRWRGRVT